LRREVLHALRQIKSAEPDETLLLMPFAYATRLLGYLERALTPTAAAAATPVVGDSARRRRPCE
jgi:hypothetical protein